MAGQGSVVVVTGASAGVGRATALRLAREGWRVGLIARDQAALQALAAEIRAAGGIALPLPCDVAEASSVFAAAERAERELGPVEAWVNNAMVTIFAPVAELTPEEFRRVTEVTYLGTVHGSMAALRLMRPRGRGVLLQVGSALAYRGIPLQSAYCGAKHAIVGFTDSLRAELRHEGSGIAVTEVHLPAVNTPQFGWARTRLARAPRPAGGTVTADTAARAIAAALRRPVREVWLGGSSLVAILGNMLAPALADRYLGRNAVEGQMDDRRLDRPAEGNLFAPVAGLHRTEGDYPGRDGALRLSGQAARLAVAGLGLAAAALAGLALGRRGHG